jgi:hypothetical protein
VNVRLLGVQVISWHGYDAPRMAIREARVERLAARRLGPLGDAGDSLHVAPDEDAHGREATVRTQRRPDKTRNRSPMPRLISGPTSIPVPGGKLIDEYVGRANTQSDGLSIAHMRAPAGWTEAFQTPASLRVKHDGGQTDVAAGQAILTAAGERVRYLTLEACEYVGRVPAGVHAGACAARRVS